MNTLWDRNKKAKRVLGAHLVRFEIFKVFQRFKDVEFRNENVSMGAWGCPKGV